MMKPVGLETFHPVVSRWFADTLGQPTPVQLQGWDAIRSGRHTLIAAPTGSGKTLAAFLCLFDQLFQEGLQQPLEDAVRVVYVSPLKALSSDIHRNLAEPRAAIRRLAREMGYPAPAITAAVRTGDTPQSERTAMIRRPPHILITTPESLYLLLTAENSRAMLRTARVVIVDEIHAVIGSRRGAHLALSLERLEHVAGPLQRIGLSATQRPVETVAAYLTGCDRPPAAIINQGHRRDMDLRLEIPRSPLEAVMSHEVWEECYDRLSALIQQHRTTLVFVNTRRLAEQLARHLSERLGEDAVTAHHGSLSKQRRFDAEERLKSGRLKALVATASLELGIDIGYVDLVCQIGSPRAISTFLQRVGRSGHRVTATPRGALFPLTRDDLVECTALLRAVRRGELDRLSVCGPALDVLAQQIVAEVSSETWLEDQLFACFRRAYPYRDLPRADFDAVVRMLAEGFATRRGRSGALVHADAVSGRLRGRRGSRLLAITAGGAIPDTADYRVLLAPEDVFIGAVNEDFAIESTAGDIFQLGNASWRILGVGRGVVRVADAHGQPPTLPFWFGEAPGRSAELSAALSEWRAQIAARLDDPGVAAWIASESGICSGAAQQIVSYLRQGLQALGAVPTQQTLVLERFFDEAGGMQMVLHAPFGSRLMRAWGLALRKRFCRTFNFELQAAAGEDALLLSLGEAHSFPLQDVFRYLHPENVGELLTQALLDAPMFQTRWRWNATIALAVPRSRGGQRVPAQIQRMQAEDLLAAAFPDAAACLENLQGRREIPDHPLVRQTIADCLYEAMDLKGLENVLAAIASGAIRCIARDTPEPSVFAHEILTARPYAFLDNAPLEERRSQAVYTRRVAGPASASELGALDASAIARVQEEAWPDVRDADELHDALLVSGFLTEHEGRRGRHTSWEPWMQELIAAGRATRLRPPQAPVLWVAAERLPEWAALYGAALHMEPPIAPPLRAAQTYWTREAALVEILRGRLALSGPTTAEELAGALGVSPAEIDAALLALENAGVILRGRFRPQADCLEWCERRLLARIHRYTLQRLRAEIEPVSAATFQRFLFAWQHVAPGRQVQGLDGLYAVLEQLDGFELPAAAWEPEIFAARVAAYDPAWLDTLSLAGRLVWGRLSPPAAPGRAGPLKTSPIALLLRDNGGIWLQSEVSARREGLSEEAAQALAALERRGALFFRELAGEAGLLSSQLERALGELVARGLVHSDSFAGLRALLTPSDRRRLSAAQRGSGLSAMELAGRWSLLATAVETGERRLERQARALLRRYGVVARRLLTRESNAAPWRELLPVFRLLEARGEIRGGRFVSALSGEQFALVEAMPLLREFRHATEQELVGISAADPLNLTGILTPGERVAALAPTRIAYRGGVPVAVCEAGVVRSLTGDAIARDVEQALLRRSHSPALRQYLARARLMRATTPRIA